MTQTQTSPEFTGRTNRYSGTCIECGEYVPANKGRLGRQGTKWVTAHDDALCGPNALPYGPPAPAAPLTVAERAAKQRARGNWFTDQKLALVDHAESYEDALRRIGESCQGMTMDYMSDFSKESAAASLARDYAAERFAVAS